jgi:hypothetical protein
VERRLNQSLRYFGVGTMIPSDDDSTSNAGKSSSEEDSRRLRRACYGILQIKMRADAAQWLSKNLATKWFNVP